MFGVKFEKDDPTIEAGVKGELGDVKPRGKFPVDESNDPCSPTVKIVVKDEVSLPELSEESCPIVSGSMGLLEADNVRGFEERSEVSDDPLEAGMLLALIGVEGEGPGVVVDNPRMWNRGVERAGRTVDRLRTHLLRVSTRSSSSWRLGKESKTSSAGPPGPPPGAWKVEFRITSLESTKVTDLSEAGM